MFFSPPIVPGHMFLHFYCFICCLLWQTNLRVVRIGTIRGDHNIKEEDKVRPRDHAIVC